MLTGKNKERFEEWFSENDYQPLFYEYPLSMQIGVIQDYADSIGYDIGLVANVRQTSYSYVILDKVKKLEGRLHKTRDEARLAAIKAFDEIVNQK